MVRGSSPPVPKRLGCCDGGVNGWEGATDGAGPSGRRQVWQKRAPDRVSAPQLVQRGPVAVAGGATRGAQHRGQKRALARTGAPQRGQVERVPVAGAVATGLPHCLQKRAPGRSGAPQWGQVGVVTAGSALRHCRQKRASGRLVVPHCGQTFTALRFRTATNEITPQASASSRLSSLLYHQVT